MRLIKAKVSGYKRLAENCELNLDTDPVCIVGPNAAGKSSFLDALTQLNDDRAFVDAEKTRRPGGGRLSPSVEARYELSEDDRGILADIPEAAEARQFLAFKDEAEGRTYLAEPFPERDLGGRQSMGRTLEMLRGTNWPEEVQTTEQQVDPPPPPFGELLDAALELAKREGEEIRDEVHAFSALGDRIAAILNQSDEREKAVAEGETFEGPVWPDFPESLRSLPADLATLALREADEPPIEKVIDKLRERVPRFLKFDEPARDLETTYDLNEEAPEADRGIHNFLALAGSNWQRAQEVSQQNDPGVTKVYVEDLDARLNEKAALEWGQSEIKIAVTLSPPILSVVISMQERDFIGFADHSDGLKAFVALRAFVASAAEEGDRVLPIVLIDEADRHLHYDAQADLVRVLEEQDEAAQIIYTTHSAGCLPRDLGLGIRAIVPETTEVDGVSRPGDHSETVNRFWTTGRGFSPLLLAMGAGAFAFASTQLAVVTEGMSDALLLPTLLREATGLERLTYQAVPGFAEATPDEVARFDLIAGRIAFLADGDQGGRAHVAKLRDNGIETEQVIYLGDDLESGLSIEDLLAKPVYLKALNGHLKAWHGVEFPADQMPEKGRAGAVEAWCGQTIGRGDKPIEVSKVDVAQRVLDQRSPDTKLLARAPTARKLHAQIEAVFEGAPQRMKRIRERAAMFDALLADGDGQADDDR